MDREGKTWKRIQLSQHGRDVAIQPGKTHRTNVSDVVMAEKLLCRLGTSSADPVHAESTEQKREGVGARCHVRLHIGS